VFGQSLAIVSELVELKQETFFKSCNGVFDCKYCGEGKQLHVQESWTHTTVKPGNKTMGTSKWQKTALLVVDMQVVANFLPKHWTLTRTGIFSKSIFLSHCSLEFFSSSSMSS
jgi:hypothetical protein